jgi:hypothetical protein
MVLQSAIEARGTFPVVLAAGDGILLHEATAMGWRPISTARRPATTQTRSVTSWRRSYVRSSMTARFGTAAAVSTSTMKVTCRYNVLIENGVLRGYIQTA